MTSRDAWIAEMSPTFDTHGAAEAALLEALSPHFNITQEVWLYLPEGGRLRCDMFCTPLCDFPQSQFAIEIKTQVQSASAYAAQASQAIDYARSTVIDDRLPSVAAQFAYTFPKPGHNPMDDQAMHRNQGIALLAGRQSVGFIETTPWLKFEMSGQRQWCERHGENINARKRRTVGAAA